MADNDFKDHVNSSQDFYALLGVEHTASQAEIRRGYRLVARTCHPDKVGPNDKAALQKFHDLQIAYGVLSDESLKELYDNFQKAKREKKARESAFSDLRKNMIEELERRENGAAKRKREELDEEQRQEMELRRLAADGKRRREELQARLRREQAQFDATKQPEPRDDTTESTRPDDIQRAVTVRYLKSGKTAHLSSEYVKAAFLRFGEIEAVVQKEKRLKPPGAKHRENYFVVTLVYKTTSGAHNAIAGFASLQQSHGELAHLEGVSWLGDKDKPADRYNGARSPAGIADSHNEDRFADADAYPHAKDNPDAGNTTSDDRERLLFANAGSSIADDAAAMHGASTSREKPAATDAASTGHKPKMPKFAFKPSRDVAGWNSGG